MRCGRTSGVRARACGSEHERQWPPRWPDDHPCANGARRRSPVCTARPPPRPRRGDGSRWLSASPFHAAVGSESLLAAIGILRELDTGTRELRPDDPHGFVPAAWRPYLALNGKVDRRIWEISLALAIRDALRAGNLFLAESRAHLSFWNLVHDERCWQETRHEAYGRLGLPSEPQAFIGKLAAALDRAARAAARGLPSNPFAAVQDGKLKLRQRDALPVPRAIRRLRETINASMPRVRIGV